MPTLASHPGEFDFIVIGAGTAGCVVASRLSERGNSVLLLEAGAAYHDPWLHLPIGYYRTVGRPKYDWGYLSEAVPSLHHRRLSYPLARAVGGCGAINGLVYVRGQPTDYEQWASLGNSGWGWQDVLPYFRRAEGCLLPEFRHYGRSGPIGIDRMRERGTLTDAFVAAALDEGFEYVDGFNGDQREGVGHFHVTVRNGLRTSTASTYLKDARSRTNLRLLRSALVTRILFHDRRAVGVEYERGGQTLRARARGEIVLSAGAINSPRLLLLSGVGPAMHLEALGVRVIVDSPHVGRNLQDHFDVSCMFRLNCTISLNERIRNPVWIGRALSQWLVLRRGPLTASAAHVGIFAKSLLSAAATDLQMHFIPLSMDAKTRRPHNFPGASLDVCQLNPTSRGFVELRSPSAHEPPKIQPGFLSSESDQRIIVAGLRMCRSITRNPFFARYVQEELAPNCDVRSDDEYLTFARETGGTIFHPVGTCRMGSDDRAVVDPQLRVKGLDGMRVVDCSIMPTIVAGNTNATAIMIAEKAADLVLSRNAS